ncbi:hypothetical protein INR49_032199 [Caranx melampygus]|nr:hypothetical protein INR49_032199 [Caranx melampygus]
MKNIAQLFLAFLPWLLLLFIPKGFCQGVHCQWGPFGDWSECDPCTKLQTRSRAMVVYAQFGGNPCGGGRTETRSCQTTRGCPLEEGCGDRFRCLSGQCISKSLKCNGDQDCDGDGLDERSCETDANFVCKEYPYPPGSDLIGKGFDAVTGTWRGTVINTRSYGGQCRTIFSGVHRYQYRLPLSIIQYSHMVTAQSAFIDEMFRSEWHYVKEIEKKGTVTGTTTGWSKYNFLHKDSTIKERRLLVLKNEIEIAQFQSNSPQYLPVSEELWKALARLPSVYDYSAYRKVLERFGTHYVSEGSLGGSLRILVKVDLETISYLESWSSSFHECDKSVRWILFIPIYSHNCDGGTDGHRNSNEYTRPENPEINVSLEGGDPQYSVALQVRELGDPKKNQEHLSNWADSIKYFPKITKKKLRPLSELVKEVQCAG